MGPRKGVVMTDVDRMRDNAIRILDTRRVLSVSTVSPDGWPHTTIVGYANVGLTVYFAILRSSEKLAHIRNDNRISFAVGEEPRDVSTLQEVYASALAFEVDGPDERSEVWDLLGSRHRNLSGSAVPDAETAVLMRAEPRHVTVLDYSIAYGRSESFDVE